MKCEKRVKPHERGIEYVLNMVRKLFGIELRRENLVDAHGTLRLPEADMECKEDETPYYAEKVCIWNARKYIHVFHTRELHTVPFTDTYAWLHLRFLKRRDNA